MKFCKMMLEKEIDGSQIFFTDETQIQTGAYIKDSIRLSKENQIKLKEGKKEAFDLINIREKKYESSIMIAGRICSFGLSRLILAENTVNEFVMHKLYYILKRIMIPSKKNIIAIYTSSKMGLHHIQVKRIKI